jgi:hypothetical protein
MVPRFLAAMVIMVAMSALGDDNVSLFIESHWMTLSNTANFQEFYSATNLPHEIYSNILAFEHNADSSLEARPLWPWAHTTGIGLIWAATDGTNYIVHCVDDYSFPAYCVTAAVRGPGGTNYSIHMGWSVHLDDYKDFIGYEREEAVRQLEYELMP